MTIGSDPEAALREGDLEGALAGARDMVRQRPGEPAPRILLFQLSCVLGQWQRALEQLQVVAELDAGTLPMAHSYGALIRAETVRSAVFAGSRAPAVLGHPPHWMAGMVQALEADAHGQHAAAAELRATSLEHAPLNPGRADETPFEWCADADHRLGPVLEVVIQGTYYWAPMVHLRAAYLEAPEDLRDLVWLPARIELVNGGAVPAFVPARYPGSEHAEPAAALARLTRWQEESDGRVFGIGQRMLCSDIDDFALFDLRELHFSDTGGVV